VQQVFAERQLGYAEERATSIFSQRMLLIGSPGNGELVSEFRFARMGENAMAISVAARNTRSALSELPRKRAFSASSTNGDC